MGPIHPNLEDLDLVAVLSALSDPTRLAIVRQLSEGGEAEAMCGAFCEYGSKSNLSYHFARLREAGITRTRVDGAARFISLRSDDLERRFPGLLSSVLSAAATYPAPDLESM